MKLDNIEKNNTWYKNGLKFKCTGCGKCCTGSPGYVWVTKEEIVNIAEFLEMPLDNFVKKYIRQKGDRYALIDKENYDCSLLDKNKCLIYNVRPKQCRTYPWWTENLNSKECWESQKDACEGINDSAPIVSYETIEKNLNL